MSHSSVCIRSIKKMLIKLLVLYICVWHCAAYSHIRLFGNILGKNLIKNRYLGSEKITKIPNSWGENRAAFAFPKVCRENRSG